MFAGKDEECWFCPLTKSQPTIEELKVGRPAAIRPETVVESLKIVREEQLASLKKYLDRKIPCGQMNCRCLNWLITGGSLYDPEKEARRYLPYIEAVREALPEYNTFVETQACSPQSAELLAKAGLHGLQYNIEVWDKKMFYVTCPGKARNMTWERWVNWLAEAVPFFQRGHMLSNQVVGLELQPPEGYYQDLARGKASVLEGHQWMIEHGVAPSWSPFVTYTGTRIENSPCPPTEYYLDIGMETHRMMMAHKLYPSSHLFFCYRSGMFMINADFARLRWGNVTYNEYRDPCMLREREEVTV